MPSSFESLDFSFEEFSKPTKYDTKTKSINNKLKDKSKDLGTVTGFNFYDADTAYLNNNPIRVGNTDGSYPQAPERKIDGVPVTGRDDANYQASRIALDNFGSNVVANPQASAELRANPLTPANQKLYDKAIKNERKNQRMFISGIEGHTGKYGRQIGSITNENGESLQDRLIQTGNATLKTNGSLPDNQEQNLEVKSNTLSDDKYVGELIDQVQSSMIKQYGSTSVALRKGSRALAKSFGVSEETLNKVLPTDAKDMFSDFTSGELANQHTADEIAGLKPETREEYNRQMQSASDDFDNGDYVSFAVKTVLASPRILADSSGEMASVMAGGAGLALAVASRVSVQEEQYIKNNGHKPDSAWYLRNAAEQTVLLGTEKFLIKSGAKTLLPKTKGRISKVAGSTVGESIQEGGESIQERFETQKEGDKTLSEIAIDKETVKSAAAGALVGGALSGSTSTAGKSIEVASSAVKVNKDKRVAEDIDLLTKEQAKNQSEGRVTDYSSVDENLETEINKQVVNSDVKDNEVVQKENTSVIDKEVTNRASKAKEIADEYIKSDKSSEDLRNALNNEEIANDRITSSIYESALKRVENHEAKVEIKSEINTQLDKIDSITLELESADKKEQSKLEKKLVEEVKVVQDMNTKFQDLSNEILEIPTFDEFGRKINSTVDGSKNFSEVRPEIDDMINKGVTEITVNDFSTASKKYLEHRGYTQVTGTNVFVNEATIVEPTSQTTSQTTSTQVKPSNKDITDPNTQIDSLNNATIKSFETRPEENSGAKWKAKSANKKDGQTTERLNKIESNKDAIVAKVKEKTHDSATKVSNVKKAIDYTYNKSSNYNKTMVRAVESVRSSASKAKRVSTDNNRAKNLLAYLTDENGNFPSEITEQILVQVPLTYSKLKEKAETSDGEPINIKNRVRKQVFQVELGRNILEGLDIELEFDSFNDINRASLEASLGLALTEQLIKDGSLVSSLTEYTEDEQKKFGKNHLVLNATTRSDIDALAKDLMPIDQIINNHTYKRPLKSKPTSYKIKGVKVSNKMDKLIKDKDSRPMKIDAKFFNKMNKQFSVEEQLLMMGWVEPATVNITKRDAVIANNNSLERNFYNGIDFIANNGNDTFYYNSNVGSNGRVGIEQNVFNPNTDKQYSRHMVMFDGKKNLVTNKNFKQFMRAIASGFDIKIERMTDAEVRQSVNEEIAKIESTDNSYFYESEGIRKFKAYQEVKSYLASNGKPYKTGLHMELDGITNGLFFSMMNYVGDVKTFKKYANAVGIFLPGDKHQSTIDYFKGNQDVYETFGENLLDQEDSMLSSLQNKKVNDQKTINIYQQTKEYILGSDDKKGIVNFRALAKSPVMTFNYSIGSNSIKNNVSDTIYDSMIEKLSGRHNGKPTKEAKDAQYNLIILAEPSITQARLNNYMKVDPLEYNPEKIGFKIDGKLINHKSLIRGRLSKTYGFMMVDNLNKEFSSLSSNIDVISKTFQSSGDAVANMLNNKMLYNTIMKIEGKAKADKLINLINNSIKTSSGSEINLLKQNREITAKNGSISNIGANGEPNPKEKGSIDGTNYESSYTIPAVLMNQSLDAESIGNLYSVVPFLSIYDAGYVDIDSAKNFENGYNASVRHIHKNYNHIKSAIAGVESKIEMLDNVNKQLSSLLKSELNDRQAKSIKNIIDFNNDIINNGIESENELDNRISLKEGLATLKQIEADNIEMKKELGLDNAIIKQVSGSIDNSIRSNASEAVEVKSEKVETRDKFKTSTTGEPVPANNFKDTIGSFINKRADTKIVDSVIEDLENLLSEELLPTIIKSKDSSNSYSKNHTLKLSGTKTVLANRNNTIAHELIHASTSLGVNEKIIKKLLPTLEAVIRKADSISRRTFIQEGKDENSKLTKTELAFLYIRDTINGDYNGQKSTSRASKELLAIFATDKSFRKQLSASVKKPRELSSTLRKIYQAVLNQLRKISKTVDVILNSDGELSDSQLKTYSTILKAMEDAKQIHKEMIEGKGQSTSETLEIPFLDAVSKVVEPVTKPFGEKVDLLDKMGAEAGKRLIESSTSKATQGMIKRGFIALKDRYPAVEIFSDFIYDNVVSLGLVQKILVDNDLKKGISREVIDELITLDHNNQNRAQAAASLIGQQLKTKFKDFSEDEKKSITKGLLASDASSLMNDEAGIKEFKEFINKDESDRTKFINKLFEDVVNKLNDKSSDTKEQLFEMIDQSSTFSINGRSENNSMVVHNPKMVATLFNEDIENEVDKVWTYLAINKSNSINTLKKIDDETLDYISTIVAANSAYELKLFGDKIINKRKGYFKQVFDTSIEGRYFSPKEWLEVKDTKGWKITRKYKNNGIFATRTNLEGRWVSGPVALIGTGTRGGDIEDSEVIVDEKKGREVFGDTAIPVRSEDGSIIKWRYEMSYNDKENILGLDLDASQTLAKTTQSMIIKSGGLQLNEKIVEEQTYNISETKPKGAVLNDISSEQPLFISVSDKLEEKLLKDGELSDIEGYIRIDRNKYPMGADLRTKDIKYIKRGTEDILLGFRENSFFSDNNRGLKQAEHLYKSMVSEFKQNVVLKMPTTHYYNFMSNLFILGASGVPAISSAKYFEEYMNESPKFKELIHKRDTQKIKVDGLTIKNKKSSRYEKAVEELDSLNKKLENHKMYPAYKYGFMQSITEEMANEGMITNDVFVQQVRKIIHASGLDKNSKTGEALPNIVSKVDKIVKILGIVDKERDTSKEGALTRVYNNLVQDISKQDPTIANTLKELYGARGSATGRAMAGAMQASDQMSRWVMFRGLTAKGISELKASQMALDSFVDYRKNITSELDMASKYAFYPFVTFASRIQRVLLRMMSTNPVRASVLGLLVNGGSNTFNSNLYDNYEHGSQLGLDFSTNVITPGWVQNVF